MKKFDMTRILLVLCLFTLLSAGVRAQTGTTITGTVSDGAEPLVGVTVIESGTTNGTTTGPGGKYTITVKNLNANLQFSYVGFVSLSEPLRGRKIIDVTLSQDVTQIEEMVVVGYGVQRKSHLTGSIAQIGGDKLVDIPVSDVAQALQGRITGLTVDNTTSEVGVAPEIRVRGTASVSAAKTPLVVVDGFPMADGLQTINPSDIKSIEIFKDASSAAIYGSQAAGGVIMITTKSGDVTAPKYSVKVYSGFKYAYQLHDMLTNTDYYNLLVQENEMGGKAVTNNNFRFATWLESQIGSTDWQRLALRDATNITSVQTSISGGKNESRYYVSANYTHDQGVMLQNEINKLAFRTKLDTKLSKKVSAGVNFSASYNKNDRPTNSFINFYRTPSTLPLYHNAFTTALTGKTGYARGNHFSQINFPWPSTVTDPDDPNYNYGNPVWYTGTLSTSAQNNPRSIMDKTVRGSEAFQGLINIYLKVDINKNLNFTTTNGVNYKHGISTRYNDYEANEDEGPATATYNSPTLVDLLSENYLNYNKVFNRKHDLGVMVGFSARKIRDEYAELSGTGFATDKIHTLNAATEFVLGNTGSYRYPDEIMLSYFARANYSYDNRYLLSVVQRLDQSSRFIDKNRNAWFPSVSLGWRASEEEFMKGIHWLDNLKLRASWGMTGNNRIPLDASSIYYSPSNYITGAGNGTLSPGMANTSKTLGNPDLTWEQTKEWNLGLDAGVFKNRIVLALDAYYSITKALLFKQPMPSFTGFTAGWENKGRVRNKGIEIGLDTRNIVKKDFQWSTNVVFSLNRNRIIDLGGDEQIITTYEDGSSFNMFYLARVGDPVIQFYGYKMLGVWNTTDEIAANPHMNDDGIGKARFADTNKDNKVDANDMVALGSPYPDFTYGITNSFSYRNFDLSFLIQGSQGGKVYNRDGNYNESQRYNRAWIKGRWISADQPGNGMTPNIEHGSDTRLPYSDYFLSDASYVTLRNAALGYTLPVKTAKKIGLRELRVYVSGNNLFYIWAKDYKGINPESRKTDNYPSALVGGYQVGGFPITSSITFGVDVTF